MRRAILSLLLCCAFRGHAQPSVYKIDGLLHRISQEDTLYAVNFWATWCKPCVKELPSFDSLHVKSQGTTTKVLLISLDFLEDMDNRLVPFLAKSKVLAECILLDESDGNSFINRINKDWSGAIPATLIKKGRHKIFKEKTLVLAEMEALTRELETKD